MRHCRIRTLDGKVHAELTERTFTISDLMNGNSSPSPIAKRLGSIAVIPIRCSELQRQ